MTNQQMEEIRRKHQPFLKKLESLAIQAIASGDWAAVDDFINFHAPEP